MSALGQVLAIVNSGDPARLSPPPYLNDVEREAFTELVDACDPRHFAQSDLPLPCSFVQATLLARSTAHDADKSLWLQAVKLLATLATRLRLAPQARLDPKTVARRTPSYNGLPTWVAVED